MDVVLSVSIFWILYGIAGLFGLQVIPNRYKGKDWTKTYIRKQGIGWIILGTTWLILFLIIRDRTMGYSYTSLLLIACATPSLVYAIAIERKYKAMLKNK